MAFKEDDAALVDTTYGRNHITTVSAEENDVDLGVSFRLAEKSGTGDGNVLEVSEAEN